MNTPNNEAIARFEDKFTVEPFSSCWLWQGSSGNDGYGQFWLNRKLEKAHRVSWMFYRDAIPIRRCILHRCDTPSCVNPDHLFIGTLSDNNFDSVKKGRFNRPNGERHYSSRLTSEQVRRIRATPEK